MEAADGVLVTDRQRRLTADQLGHIRLFKELGVGIVQLAYNTQNLIGSGCYESQDGGLSDFGREALAEMTGSASCATCRMSVRRRRRT